MEMTIKLHCDNCKNIINKYFNEEQECSDCNKKQSLIDKIDYILEEEDLPRLNRLKALVVKNGKRFYLYQQEGKFEISDQLSIYDLEFILKCLEKDNGEFVDYSYQLLVIGED